jgi:hypothetical protein
MKATLDRKIRSLTHEKNQIPAVVVDVVGNRASVRLVGNGSLAHNLEILGGPIVKGQQVMVDYSGKRPVVNAVGKEYATIQQMLAILARMQKASAGTTAPFGWMINRFSGGVLAQVYDPDSTGLEDALTDASAGDLIYCPNASISGDVVIPIGVSVIGMGRNCEILGKVTLSEQTSLYNMKIRKQASDSSDITALEGPETGDAWVIDCEIHAYQCGDGSALAVHMNGSGTFFVRESLIIADSRYGTGVAAKQESGGLRIEHSEVYGKTADFEGEVSVYSITEGYSQITCIDPVVWAMPTLATNDVYPIVMGNQPRDTSKCAGDTVLMHKETASYIPGFICTNQKIYYFDQTQDNPAITEYDIKSGAKVTVELYEDDVPNYLFYVYVEDRKIMAVGKGADANHNAYYLLDFAAGTSTNVWEFLISSGGATYTPMGMISFEYNSEIYCICQGDYLDASSSRGVCFFIYNYTTDTGSVSADYHVSSGIGGTNSFYCAPAFDGTSVWILPNYLTPGGTSKRIVLHRYNLSTSTHSKYTYITGSTSYDAVNWQLMVDYTQGELHWFSTDGGADTNRVYWIKFIISTTGFVEVREGGETFEDPVWYRWGFNRAAGQTDIYAFDVTNEVWRDADDTQLFAYTYPWNWKPEYDHPISKEYDDGEDRNWYYQSGTLKGVRFSDQDVRTIGCSITEPTTGAEAIMVWLLGSFFIVGCFTNASGENEYYLVR